MVPLRVWDILWGNRHLAPVVCSPQPTSWSIHCDCSCLSKSNKH